MNDVAIRVPDMSCGHCVASISNALESVAGVDGIEIDLDARRVGVTGEGIDQGAIVAAIRDAGYEPEPA